MGMMGMGCMGDLALILVWHCGETIPQRNGGFLKWGYPKILALFHGKSRRSKWMIYLGYPHDETETTKSTKTGCLDCYGGNTSPSVGQGDAHS